MNSEPTNCNCNCKTGVVNAIAILGAFLIMAVMVWAMQHYTQAPLLNANRAAERAKALAEIRAAETEALNNTGWIDQGKGIVRLRIEDAMNLVEREWQDPAAGRSNLIARVEKATAAPPKAPAAPNPFE
jgi:uncharacterized protein YdaU (DUF1376 family)